MNLTNNTRSDIVFAVNCLTRHSVAPTMRHWNDIKNIIRYLNDNRFWFILSKKSKIWFNRTCWYYYLCDLQNGRTQTGFMFLHRWTGISWKSVKPTLIATSMNHSEIIALYEASRECAWLWRVINHIQISYDICALESPMIIYDDNVAYDT
jgi:hypothetical protein